MGKTITRYLPAFLLACVMPLTASAVDMNAALSKPVATAAAHAGMALGASDLQMAHTHLHHVVNCLVGPAGKGFNAEAGNPCKDMGQGAIIDAKGDAATEARLHTALAAAEQGLKTTTLESAHADAKKAMTILQAD